MLPAEPYWTAADEAELDLLAHEFTKTALLHRHACDVCQNAGPWCADLAGAFAAVTEWKAGRELRSRAAWLRARQTVAEWGTEVRLAA